MACWLAHAGVAIATTSPIQILNERLTKYDFRSYDSGTIDGRAGFSRFNRDRDWTGEIPGATKVRVMLILSDPSGVIVLL
jgi:hypothetical protein